MGGDRCINFFSHMSVCSYLRLYDDICIRGSPPEVSLLADVGGEGGGGVADAVHALRARAVVVELPKMGRRLTLHAGSADRAVRRSYSDLPLA